MLKDTFYVGSMHMAELEDNNRVLSNISLKGLH